MVETSNSTYASGSTITRLHYPKMSERKPHAYAIKRIDVKDPEYISEVPEHLRNQDLPGFPSTTLFVGRPGSGKTNALMNLLMGENFWFGFYDKIYLCGPTVENQAVSEH